MTRQSETTPEPGIESLFLSTGERFSDSSKSSRLLEGARVSAGRVAVFLAAVTWLPLAILAVVEGVAWTDRLTVPLLKDFLPYGQFLLAVPVLVLGENVVGRRLGWTVAELRRSDVLAPEDTPRLEALLTRAVGLWRGRSVNGVLLLLTYAAAVPSLWVAPEWLTGGWQYAGDRITLPAWWYLLVSLPVWRFLALRWLWRLLVWTFVLWKVGKLKLQPKPAHPDRAGGLAFLGASQAAFGLLVFAFGLQLSCLLADAIRYENAKLMAYRGQVTAFVLISVIVLLLPLLPFVPKLVRARGESIVFLTGSGYQGAQYLERKLRDDRSGALPTDDVSGLCDFGALYENALQMKPLPLVMRHVLTLVLAALLPFLPLVFLQIPAQEVFQTLANLLL